MKALHLFSEITFSGAEIMYANAAKLFKNKGIELLICSTGKRLGDYAFNFEEQKVKTYHKPILFTPFSYKGIKYYLELYNFLKEKRIDLVHIHRPDLYFVPVITRLANVKCIKTQHSAFRNRWFTKPIAIFRRYFHRKICDVTFQSIGESVYKNELHYYKNPSVQINNWYDHDRFYPAKDYSEKLFIREKLGIPVDAYVIISIGGCSEIKNHTDIIKAISLIDDRIQNVCYLHLGFGHTEQKEKELAKKLNVFNAIKFLGYRKNVRDYLIASDVYVMPSRLEGLGNAALEAMACKIPTILYDVPGLRDLIDEDDNGFLIDPHCKILAEKIKFCCENPKIAKEKAQNSYYFVEKYFSMDKNVKKIISLYESNHN